MELQITALLIAISVFAIASLRGVHIGIAMFVAATGVGVWVAELPLDDVIGGFPLDLLILLAGITFFFGIAQANGTVGKLIGGALDRVGERTSVLPLTFFIITAAIAAMGNPGGAMVMIPIGMTIAVKKGLDPMLMALAMGTGTSAGGFAPSSLYGIVAASTAEGGGITISPMLLFAIALGANLVLLAVAYGLFARRRNPVLSGVTVGAVGTEHALPNRSAGIDGFADGAEGPDAARTPYSLVQKATVGAMAALIGTVVGAEILGADPNIGVVAFALGVCLALIDPRSSSAGISRIDWSTILLVGGVITYVGVLESLGAIDLLGEFAASMSTPLLAAFVVCMFAGLVSAFASTLGMMAAVVPLAIPVIMTSDIPGWALVSAIAVCASIVDTSPFSTVGASMVATLPDEGQRPRVTRFLMRWGLSMVLLGPLAMLIVVIAPSMVF